MQNMFEKRIFFGKMRNTYLRKKNATKCIFRKSNSFASCRWKDFKVNIKVTCFPKSAQERENKAKNAFR